MIDFNDPRWKSELVSPDYNIYRFTDNIYKIVHFKCTAPRLGIRDRSKFEHHDKKLDASISRAKRLVLEYALCNEWKYFCTFTLGGSRFDLDTWVKDFTQLIRDLRKKYNFDFRYLFVPEQHQDGAWHMHGLFSDITPLLVSFHCYKENGFDVPYKLVRGQYLDWPDYSNKFGFCSFGEIENKVAVSFYILKYISKSIGLGAAVNKHTYFASRNLQRASLKGDVFGNCSYLDQFLTNHYEFCDTGMTHLKDGCDWTFGLEFMNFEPFPADCVDDPVVQSSVDHYMDSVSLYIQDSFEI